MPKQRSTCTRCSQRRQKCDRKTPCSRCIQNNEDHLCTTHWTSGYNPSVHRKYPRKPSATATTSSDTSSTLTNSPPTDPTAGPVFAIGQSKFLDITIGSLLHEKDAPTPQLEAGFLSQSLQSVRAAIEEPNRVLSFCSPAAKELEMEYVQSLLPDRQMVLRIVDYYHECMAYWCGGLWHWPSFRAKLVGAYAGGEMLELRGLDWRWNGLLFAILSSGVIGCPERLSEDWGISVDDKVKLARAWGACSVTCLNLGNYTSQFHINSIQAIYTLHAYEHLAGSTNQWISMRSVAAVIAKGLGLHRLTPHPADKSPTHHQSHINHQIALRIWSYITAQEWLCSTSQSTYSVTIQKRHFTTPRPAILDEESMLPVDDATPTFTLVGRYFYDYASLMIDFHNTMLDLADAEDAVRYAAVLKFDGEMRALCAEKIPGCFKPGMPIQSNWPKWSPWARRLHQASTTHKLIMLHQSFLAKSLRDTRYTYTRYACSSAAKKIINLYNPPTYTAAPTTTRDPHEPQWWVEQAFVVTAGICLVLDLFSRAPAGDEDGEAREYKACVQRAIEYLQGFFTSSVALHGVRLLASLLGEYGKMHESVQVPDPESNVQVSTEDVAQFNFDIETVDFEGLMDYLPMEGGVDGNMFVDTFLGMASGSFV